MPDWLKQWLPSLILPVLGLAWYLMDDRSQLRERLTLLEHKQMTLLEEKLPNRTASLEGHLEAIRLSLEGLSRTIAYAHRDE